MKRYMIHLYRLVPFTAVNEDEAIKEYERLTASIEEDIHASLHEVQPTDAIMTDSETVH